LTQILKNGAGNYLVNIPKEKLLMAMAKTPAIAESIKLLLENILPNIYVKHYLLNALRGHEDNMSNPVIKVLFQAQEVLYSRLEELKKKNIDIENRCDNLENLFSEFTNSLSKSYLASISFMTDQSNVQEVLPLGKEEGNSLDC